ASHKKACKTVDVLAALKKLQLKLGLPPSGVLDGKTKQVLSSGRCGNKDNDHPLLVVSKENATHGESDDERRSHHRDKRSLLETIIGGRNKHALSPSVRRRKRMLAEIMERIANENDTERYRVHPRRKRSTPMDPYRPGDQAYLTKFKQGEEPITWRLLEAGYSKRFPITDQQSMLELAFRMWSEVVPLRFRRQDGGDIDDVDVQIAFGKGAIARRFSQSLGNRYDEGSPISKCRASECARGLGVASMGLNQVGVAREEVGQHGGYTCWLRGGRAGCKRFVRRRPPVHERTPIVFPGTSLAGPASTPPGSPPRRGSPGVAVSSRAPDNLLTLYGMTSRNFR
ncbi:hypothetical protein NP493_5158g00000, partial [Ridgeia piscesae]